VQEIEESGDRFMVQFDFQGDSDVMKPASFVIESIWSDINTRKGFRGIAKWTQSTFVVQVLLDRFAERISRFTGVEMLDVEPQEETYFGVPDNSTWGDGALARGSRSSRSKASYKETE